MQDEKKYVLAVDGGNSKTVAAVAEWGGEVMALARAGGTNYQAIGRKAAGEILAGLIQKVLGQAGLSSVDAACYGMAGADREKDFAVFREILTPLNPARKMMLVNDTLLVLRAGTPDGVGVALIGGAGSNCIGRNRAGRREKAWGLGPLSGDKANAGALAVDGVIAAMKGIDGRGPRTILAEKFQRALKLEALEDIIECEFHDEPRKINLISLAPLVFEAANEGDAAALEILRSHAEAAAEAALAVMRRLFSPTEAVPLVLGGSVFQKGSNPTLVRTLEELVRRKFPHTALVLLKDQPLLGGIWLALDELGLPLLPDQQERLRQSLAEQLVRLEENAAGQDRGAAEGREKR